MSPVWCSHSVTSVNTISRFNCHPRETNDHPRPPPRRITSHESEILMRTILLTDTARKPRPPSPVPDCAAAFSKSLIVVFPFFFCFVFFLLSRLSVLNRVLQYVVPVSFHVFLVFLSPPPLARSLESYLYICEAVKCQCVLLTVLEN